MSTAPALTAERWTIADLQSYPIVEGNRYEIVEGDLLVSTQPHLDHQETSDLIVFALRAWMMAGGSGKLWSAPGVIFDEENAVAPDVAWVSAERVALVLGDDGKLHDAPDLAVEALAPGQTNLRRDREAKLRLYSVRGVREYWIADWESRRIQVFRREGGALKLAATLLEGDGLTSPLLPGFSVEVSRLFPG